MIIIPGKSTTLDTARRPALVVARLQTLAGVCCFALLTAAAAKIHVPMIPVPMTMQTAAVLLAGLMLGPIAGAASQMLYLGMGLAGLPVFAGPLAGIVYLFGPTGGYLLGFIPAAAAAGWIAGPRGQRRLGMVVLGAAAGTAVIFALGVSWLAAVQRLGWQAALTAGLIPFWLGAVAKLAMVVAAARLVDARRPARR